MAYVAMTRGRSTNEAFLYQHTTGEADHQHTTPKTTPDIHTLRRGNTYNAAHHFRHILAHDDRPRTMQDEAECTPLHQLPDEVADLLERNDTRRAQRCAAWRHQTSSARSFRAGHERATAAAQDVSTGLEVGGIEI
jgi:hypothetical protein